MQISLKNRSIKISNSTNSSVGTGILIDSYHILTCAHVIQSVLKGVEEITDTTPIEILPIGNAADEWLTATIVHSYLESKKGENGVRRYIFPEHPKKDEDSEKLKFDYVKDIILLKTQQPVFPNVSFIDWRDYLGGDEISIEVFGNHKVFGQSLTVTLEGEGYYKLHQCRLVDSEQSLRGASGAGLLLEVNSVTDQVIGYGMLIGESKITQEGKKVVERAFYISGKYIEAFLSSYEGLFFPSNSMVKQTKPLQKEQTEREFSERALLASSLIDREFILEIRRELVESGLACITLESEKADIPRIVGDRLARFLEVRQEVDASISEQKLPLSIEDTNKRFFARDLEWPQNRGSATQILKILVDNILNGFIDTGDNVSIWEHFHTTMREYDRFVIGINFSTPFLSLQDQQAFLTLVNELQVYKKPSPSEIKTQILLYVVDEKKVSNFSLLTQRVRRKKHLKAMTKRFKHWRCHELESIEVRHILNWEKTLVDLGHFDRPYASQIVRDAEKLIPSDGTISIGELRKSLIQKIEQSGF